MDLHRQFWDRLTQRGTLQRRSFREGNGKRGKDKWTRCYVELAGPRLQCWRAGGWDMSTESAAKLKDNSAELEFPVIDVRLGVTIEPVDDYRLGSKVVNAFVVNNAHGQNRIVFMASNSTACKDWLAALVLAAKEAFVLDQRLTSSLLSGRGVLSFKDALVPDPPLAQLQWPGSAQWYPIHLRIETKKGCMRKLFRSKLEQCVYFYEPQSNKRCLARIARLSDIYALGDPDETSFSFVIEAEGKRKSDKFGGFKSATRVMLRVPSEELRTRWIGILSNCFEITAPGSRLSTLPAERPPLKDESPSRASAASSLSFHSPSRASAASSLSFYSHSRDTVPPSSPTDGPRLPFFDGMAPSPTRRRHSQAQPLYRRQCYDHPPPVVPSYYQSYNGYEDIDYAPAMPMVPPILYRSNQTPPSAPFGFGLQPYLHRGIARSPYRMPGHAPLAHPLYQSSSFDGGYCTMRRSSATGRSDEGRPELEEVLAQVVESAMGLRMPCDLLYDIYSRTCRDNGRPAGSAESVKKWMLEMGYQLRRGDGHVPAQWMNIAYKC